jgi:hypothetical protein
MSLLLGKIEGRGWRFEVDATNVCKPRQHPILNMLYLEGGVEGSEGMWAMLLCECHVGFGPRRSLL